MEHKLGEGGVQELNIYYILSCRFKGPLHFWGFCAKGKEKIVKLRVLSHVLVNS